MRQWSATIRNFYKGRYYNNEQILSVKANRIDAATRRAVTRYLDNLPKGTRIEGLSITIQAIKVKKGTVKKSDEQSTQEYLNRLGKAAGEFLRKNRG